MGRVQVPLTHIALVCSEMGCHEAERVVTEPEGDREAAFVGIEASEAGLLMTGDHRVNAFAHLLAGQEQDLAVAHVVAANGELRWQAVLDQHRPVFQARVVLRPRGIMTLLDAHQVDVTAKLQPSLR